MSDISAAQRYAKAAAQASRDRKRPISEVPTVDVGEVTVRQLRALMGMSLQQLSEALVELTQRPWSVAQLSRVETGVRPMSVEMKQAITVLVEHRKRTS